jgi:hypothetical protein
MADSRELADLSDLNGEAKVMRPLLLLVLSAFVAMGAQANVLIVADEFPAMEVIATRLKIEEQIESTIISQKDLSSSLATYEAVIVYIHGALSEKAENTFIDYTKAGGKLVVLHHSISSTKRKNASWFSFLGVSLPEGDLAHGGYKWIEGVSFDLLNLAPSHFIMTNKVVYPEHITCTDFGGILGKRALASFRLDQTEVYLNHAHTQPRTLLMGLKYIDTTSGKTYMHDHAGWLKSAGQGTIIYFMPGHTKQDFQNTVYGRIVVNAVIYKT